jgi:HEAT repeat protein
VKSDDALLRREAIVYATLSMQRHELEAPFDPTPALADPDVSVRAAAAWSVGQLKIASASAALVACLDNGYAALRREAARALGKIGAKEASNRLNMCAHDIDPLVREASSEAVKGILKR